MELKKEFKIFENVCNLVYLDSSATTQRPRKIVEAMQDYDENYNSNILRGVYHLSERSTKMVEDARKKVAKFIGAKDKEIIFTRGATEGINIVALGIKGLDFEGKDEIVISEMEHHANILPWIRFAQENEMKIKKIPIKGYELDYEALENIINEKTAVVAISTISNVLGTVHDVKRIVEIAKSFGALTIVDATQSVARMKTDVRELGCDFLVFSSHKMYGSFGVGVLYMNEDLIDRVEPMILGGGIVENVLMDSYKLLANTMRFEAGTLNISGIVGLGAAVDFILKIGISEIEKIERELTDYAKSELEKLGPIEIYSSKKSLGVVSFNLFAIHPHDVSSIMAEKNICIRAGHHCAIPLIDALELRATCRISFGVYNTKGDIDILIIQLKEIIRRFRG